MRLGLRAQILVALLLVTLVAITSVGAIAIWQTRAVLAAERFERAAAAAQAAGRLLELALEPGRGFDAETRRRIERLRAELLASSGADELTLFDADGRAVIGEAPTSAEELAQLASARAGAPARAQVATGPEGVRLVAYAPVGPGALRLGFPLDAALDRLLGRARNAVLLLGALDGLLLLVTAAWILRGVVVRPVRALEAAARRVADGDLDARVEVRGPGELAELADAFDRMTGALRTGRESLIRSQKLAAVGGLAAGVAHEIGNPLAAIRGYVEMLVGETDAKPIDPALRKDMLGRVHQETLRIHRIVQELLAYARQPRDREAPTAVDVGKAVAAALSLVKAQARYRGVTTVVEIPADLPPVRATESALVQVLLNLALNAAGATDGEGQVAIGARAEGDRVIVSIADDGPGIPADLRPRIFDPFFTTKDPGEGTGLGLSVSQAIVEGLGGTLRLADSERGARFEVDLPGAPEPPVSQGV